MDLQARGRQETIVLAAPSDDWDNGRGGAPRPAASTRKKPKKLIMSDDEDDDNHHLRSNNSITQSISPDLKSQRSFKSDWSNTRTHQNFLVDSIEIERKVNGNSSSGGNLKDGTNSSKQQQPSQQLSPYLSLPKQPPTMSLVQEGEFLFQEIDRDGDGIVSKIDIIKALRVNSPLAKV